MRSLHLTASLSLVLNTGLSRELWSADRMYSAGDEVLDPHVPEGALTCLDFPLSDFCSIAPDKIGGRSGWANKREQQAIAELKSGPTPSCKTSGVFHRDDLYCAEGEPYVWRCKSANCNYIKPRDGDRTTELFWDTWKLTPFFAPDLKKFEGDTEYNPEVSKAALITLLGDELALREGF